MFVPNRPFQHVINFLLFSFQILNQYEILNMSDFGVNNNKHIWRPGRKGKLAGADISQISFPHALNTNILSCIQTTVLVHPNKQSGLD